MRKGTKILLFTGLGIFAAGILISVIVFALNGFHYPPFNSLSDLSGQGIKESVEKDITEEFDSIKVETSSSDVAVCRSADGICRIRYGDHPEEPVSEIIVENHTLIFRQVKESLSDWKHPGWLLGQFLTGIGAEDGKDLDECTVFLPEKVYDKLEIQTASGEITVDQDLTFSEVSLESGSGDIEIQNVKGVEFLNLATTSGEIEASNMELASQITASSISGDIEISRLTAGGKAAFSSVSGEVTLKHSDFSDTEAETQSGDIYIEYLTAEKLKAKTTSGEVSGRIDADINVRGTTVSGSYSAPSGSKWEWDIETVSGDISLGS